MLRKTIYDREWLKLFHPVYLAEQEKKLGGTITELTMFGGPRLPETESHPTHACVEIAYDLKD